MYARTAAYKAAHLSIDYAFQECSCISFIDAAKPVPVTGAHCAIDQHIACILHAMHNLRCLLCMKVDPASGAQLGELQIHLYTRDTDSMLIIETGHAFREIQASVQRHTLWPPTCEHL